MKAINIQWDTDGDEELRRDLPTEMEIPQTIFADAEDGDDIGEIVGDYLSDEVGFCHFGFEIED